MVPIYVKLGTATEFRDERLKFELGSEVPAGILDYTNTNENIISGLISGEIVQITEAEFYALVPPDTEPPIIVLPGSLISITEFLGPCPLDSTVLFAHYGGKWYKILWSTIKQCVGAVAPLIEFRVGDPDNDLDELPDIGENEFVSNLLIGKVPGQLLVTVNGVELYPKSKFTAQGDEADNDWYTLHEDSTPGKFKRSGTFGSKEIIVIRG